MKHVAYSLELDGFGVSAAAVAAARDLSRKLVSTLVGGGGSF